MIAAELVRSPIPPSPWPAPPDSETGALAEFRGIVRATEKHSPIRALRYTAYEKMALAEIHRIASEISKTHPVRAACIIHRLGEIPVGETAIYVGAASSHRAAAFAFLSEFMDALKRDVPIWKETALP
jgi:molybdopterin synthase catalytic subunit